MKGSKSGHSPVRLPQEHFDATAFALQMRVTIQQEFCFASLPKLNATGSGSISVHATSCRTGPQPVDPTSETKHGRMTTKVIQVRC